MRPLDTDPVTEGRGDRTGKRAPKSEALHGETAYFATPFPEPGRGRSD